MPENSSDGPLAVMEEVQTVVDAVRNINIPYRYLEPGKLLPRAALELYG